MNEKRRPLEGLKILEMGQLIAGPFCGSILAGFGAQVIKVEKPGTGDPLRVWRKMHNGTSLWWLSMGRNKKSITLDLNAEKGQEIARRLAGNADVVIENFKPGTMEKWGLGYEDLKKINPGIIMARVSGYGQTGPYSGRPGFANVAEGFGGIRYTSGYPDRPPVRTGTSLGDTLAGLHAALGVLTAVYHRDVNGGTGQMVDVAIYEAVFNMMESALAEYDKFGHVRERSGPKIEGIVPTSTYECKDGRFIIIGGNGDSVFQRLMRVMDRPDIGEDAALEHNDGRVLSEARIDKAIAEWARKHKFDDAYKLLLEAGVPCGGIYSIADIASNEHYKARGVFDEIEISDGEKVKIPAVLPFLSETPGRTDWPGPRLGQHNDEIYRDLLAMSGIELEDLRNAGIV